MKKKITINFNNFQQAVAKIAMIAENEDCNVYARSDNYIINAKSVLGLLSLDLSKPIEMEYTGDDAHAKVFFSKINDYTITSQQ